MTVIPTFDVPGFTIGTPVPHSFPSGGDFRIDTVEAIKARVDADPDRGTPFDTPPGVTPQTKLIVLEDTYKRYDRDYEDWYWKVEIETAEIDIDVDSNNDGVINEADDRIEEESGQEGVLVPVDDDDSDNEGVVDKNESFYKFNKSAIRTPGDSFKKLVVSVPQFVDITQAYFKFSYSYDNPFGVVRTGDGGFNSPYEYANVSSSGNLRIWRRDAEAERVAKPLNIEGDSVDGNLWYGGAMWAALGITTSTRTVELFIQGVDNSESLGSDLIELSIDVDGFYGNLPIQSDKVRTTAVDFDLVSSRHRQRGTQALLPLRSAIAVWPSAGENIDLGWTATPGLGQIENPLPQLEWNLDTGSATTTRATSIAPRVVTLPTSTSGEVAAIATLLILNVKREIVVYLPDVGDISEDDYLDQESVESFGYAQTVFYLHRYDGQARDFAYRNARPSDQLIQPPAQNDAQNNSSGNALKHAYFTGRVSARFSSNFALGLMRAHEYDAKVKNWSATESATDLFNNEKGVVISDSLTSQNGGVVPSDSFLENGLRTGLLSMLDSGNLMEIYGPHHIILWTDSTEVRHQW